MQQPWLSQSSPGYRAIVHMKMKEIRIRWISTDPVTDLEFSTEIVFDSSYKETEAAYTEAIGKMRTCQIGSDAHIETTEITEEK